MHTVQVNAIVILSNSLATYVATYIRMHVLTVNVYTPVATLLFLNLIFGQRRPGFLKSLLSGKSVCACVCVHPPGYEKPFM